jgi:hypothetical protein
MPTRFAGSFYYLALQSGRKVGFLCEPSQTEPTAVLALRRFIPFATLGVKPHTYANDGSGKRVAALEAFAPPHPRMEPVLLLLTFFASASTLVLTETLFVEVALMMKRQFSPAHAAVVALGPINSLIHFENLV